MSDFLNFDLDEKIIKTLDEIGYKKPTPIQEQAIPKVLEGLDLIASAQTGTGKTAAFMLPALQMIANTPVKKDGGPQPQVLVLVPTRELAMQVAGEAVKYSKHLRSAKTVCIYGGVPYPIQRRELSRRHDILVATPGRLLDHIERGRIDLSKLKMLILDEADRMLDMGFVGDVEKIASNTPKQRQTLLFSATLDRKVLSFSKKLQNDPFEIAIKPDLTVKSNIEQRLYYVDNIDHKLKLLDEILETADIDQAIIFTSTKSQANKLSDDLRDNGYLTAPLHGDMDQKRRTRTISKLRHGKIRILVATDVAGRGIDIPSLSHVINFDLTFQPEDFIHRIGRTGRAGASGIAITFATYREDAMLSRINKLIGNPMTTHTIEGFEPKPKSSSSNPNQRNRRHRPSFGKRPRNFSSSSRNGNNDSSFRSRDSSFRGRDSSSQDRDSSSRSGNYSSRGRSSYSRDDNNSSRGRDSSSQDRDSSSRSGNYSSRGRSSFSRDDDNSFRGKDSPLRESNFSSRGKKPSSRDKNSSSHDSNYFSRGNDNKRKPARNQKSKRPAKSFAFR